MKIVAQIVAFIIGTFIVTFIRSDGGTVTTGDLLFGALIGGGIASSVVGALFKDEPPLREDVRQSTVSPSIKPVDTDKPIDTEAQESLRQTQDERSKGLAN